MIIKVIENIISGSKTKAEEAKKSFNDYVLSTLEASLGGE